MIICLQSSLQMKSGRKSTLFYMKDPEKILNPISTVILLNFY